MRQNKKWGYFSPTFDFAEALPLESSAWSGHIYFAYDLVSNMDPKCIVELGTHKGNSLFSFAQAVKDHDMSTKLHGIDIWEGDVHAGFYGETVFEKFNKVRKLYYDSVDIVPHKNYFDDVLSQFEDGEIDILHIDGLHTYDAVKHDFLTWLPKVNRGNGIILFHDISEVSDGFGVYKLWDELSKGYKTFAFEHYHGLGVLFINPKTYHEVEQDLHSWEKLYPLLSEKNIIHKQLSDSYRRTGVMMQKALSRLHQIKTLRDTNLELNTELTNYRDNLGDTSSLNGEIHEFSTIKNTKLYKCWKLYRKVKRSVLKTLSSFRHNGVKITVEKVFSRSKMIMYRLRKKDLQNDLYLTWVNKNKVTRSKRTEIDKELGKLTYHPLISVVMPVYNVDVKYIKEAVKSLKNQIYTNWELCIADDASTNHKLIKYLKKLSKDKMVKVKFRQENGHISEATNTALGLAEGEFVALMDNDDIIHPDAFYEVVLKLNEDQNIDIFYSDEDKLEIDGRRVEPFFKPDWSPDFLMSTNYISHLGVIRRSLINEVGGFRKGYEGAQDYDLYLRLSEKTNKIVHIPKVLYTWRKIPGSTAAEYVGKDYVDQAAMKSLESALERRSKKGTVSLGRFPGSFRVKYAVEGNPLVSIIIPTKDKVDYIRNCISSLLEKTTYTNFEILIVDTGSTEIETISYYSSIRQDSRIRFVNWDKDFNYSAVNNYGVEFSKGEYIILLNNDTTIISPDWIEGLLEHAQRDEVGAVGAKLHYPDGRIQHAGVILGINGGEGRGVAGHAFKFFPEKIQGFPVQKDIIKNYSAVTAACLMVKKSKFQEVGGLDEKYRIAFNDVDFSLKLCKKGYFNVYTPYVELFHHESISVGTPESNTRNIEEFAKEIDMMYIDWEKLILNDPFYNPNLTRGNEDFSILKDK